MPVRVVERVGHLPGDPHRLVHAELRFPVQPAAQRFALDVRHDVEEEAVGGAGVEERQDVRVLELGGGGDLLHEALGTEDGGQLGLQHLDGHLAQVAEVLGQVDRGHAARAELPLDAVAVGEGDGETVGSSRHFPFSIARSTSTRQLKITFRSDASSPALVTIRNRVPSGVTS